MTKPLYEINAAILEALSQVVDLPDNLISFEMKLGCDQIPEIACTYSVLEVVGRRRAAIRRIRPRMPDLLRRAVKLQTLAERLR